MNVLVVMEFREKHRQLMQREFPAVRFTFNRQPSIDEIKAADAVIGNIKPQLLQYTDNLKWLQLNSAGTDGYCVEGVMPRGAVLTNATGAYGLALSEYMLAALMAMQKKLYRYHDNQKQKLWHDEGEVTSVYGSTAVVVGLGDIGSCLAERLHALGASVIGVKRRIGAKPEYLSELITLDELDEYLPKADIVASVLPGTAATEHIFSAAKFKLMKQGAFFINAGRGSAVVEDDLCDAVESGRLAGAALDVTEIEPLPSTSRLWQAENIHITPHTAGQYHLPATLDNIVSIAADNLHRLIEGRELKNQVDFATGYKK